MNYTAEEILSDVKNGIPIIITDDIDRENEGDFFVAGSVVNKEAISLMLNEGRGLICTPISQDIASRLELEPMVQNNSSAHATAFTVSIDHISNSTGISLEDRLSTIKNLALTNSKPGEFMKPGHIFPLISKNGGLKKRRGHTEAAIELCKLAGLTSVGVICEILNIDGSIARSEDLKVLLKKYSLKIISIQDIIDIYFSEVIKTNLPTKNGNFDLYHFETPDESFSVLGLERNLDKIPLLRIHSECFTGDTFGSLRCDCGDQLDQSIKKINEYGHGFVVYLKQEG
jgi:3,4-dihydroxy 2-butanone 4-phosphate synthase/GTP cyclohydrolase II